jgi:general secretion pathway protein D
MCGLAFIPHVQAQTRPGSAPRGTGATGSAARRSTGTTSFGGGSRSSGPRQYRSNTELGDAIIQIDPETRSLVIVTDEQTHGELMKVIETLDRPKPQVLIKVVFVEVTYNKDSDIGVEASYTFNLGKALPGQTGNRTVTNTSTSQTGTLANPGTSTTTSTVTTPLDIAASLASTVGASSVFGIPTTAGTEGTFLRIINDDWSATLRALASKGKVEVLSRPSIMARNNQEAVIVVGQEIPFITNSRITDNGQTINTVTYDNIGIILRVTPFITSEGTVEMIVAPEISNLTDQSIPISNTASSPVIAKRSAETVVVTPNARTVVIGGLMESAKVESIKKVPILGDIPVIGFPFRRTIKSDVKRELIIFLTPYIVNQPESLTEVARKEVGETTLFESTFQKSEFDRFIDGPSLFPEKALKTDVHIEENGKRVDEPVQRAPAQPQPQRTAPGKSVPSSRATPAPTKAVPVAAKAVPPQSKVARTVAKATPAPPKASPAPAKTVPPPEKVAPVAEKLVSQRRAVAAAMFRGGPAPVPTPAPYPTLTSNSPE